MTTFMDELSHALPPGQDVWDEHELVIVASISAAGVPSYRLTRLRRQTEKQVVTVDGQKFWKNSLHEVGGARQLIPSFAPAFPILRAQLATHEHRRAVSEAYWKFMDNADRTTAAALVAVLHDFLATDPQ